MSNWLYRAQQTKRKVTDAPSTHVTKGSGAHSVAPVLTNKKLPPITPLNAIRQQTTNKTENIMADKQNALDATNATATKAKTQRNNFLVFVGLVIIVGVIFYLLKKQKVIPAIAPVAPAA